MPIPDHELWTTLNQETVTYSQVKRQFLDRDWVFYFILSENSIWDGKRQNALLPPPEVAVSNLLVYAMSDILPNILLIIEIKGDEYWVKLPILLTFL